MCDTPQARRPWSNLRLRGSSFGIHGSFDGSSSLFERCGENTQRPGHRQAVKMYRCKFSASRRGSKAAAPDMPEKSVLLAEGVERHDRAAAGGGITVTEGVPQYSCSSLRHIFMLGVHGQRR